MNANDLLTEVAARIKALASLYGQLGEEIAYLQQLAQKLQALAAQGR